MVRCLADRQINVVIHRCHSESVCSFDFNCCQHTCQVVCSTLLTDPRTIDKLNRVHTDLRAWNTTGLNLSKPMLWSPNNHQLLNIHFCIRTSEYKLLYQPCEINHILREHYDPLGSPSLFKAEAAPISTR